MQRHSSLMRSISRRRTRARALSQPSPRSGPPHGQSFAFVKHSATLPGERRSAGRVYLPRAPPREVEESIEVYSVSASEKKAVDLSNSCPALDVSAGVESEEFAIESDEADKDVLEENVDGHVDEEEDGTDESEQDYLLWRNGRGGGE